MANLFDLDDDPAPAPPFVASSDTSRAASEFIEPHAATLRRAVLAEIARHGDSGRTCDECEIALDMRHQTCSARIRELAKMGLIRDSGRRRKTRSGRLAVVWVAVQRQRADVRPSVEEHNA